MLKILYVADHQVRAQALAGALAGATADIVTTKPVKVPVWTR